MKKNTILYQEKSINYIFKGDITNKAIVFIHGNSLSSKTFEYQFNQIDSIPLLAIDLPGHGESEPALYPEKSYSLPEFSKAIMHILKDLKVENYILVGHSLGGHLAIETIEELPSAKGIFIFGTPPLGMPPQMEKMFLPNPLAALLFQENIKDEEIIGISKSFTTPQYENIISENIKCSDGKSRANLGSSFALGLFKNEVEIVKNLKVPIAIVHGEQDNFINKIYLEELNIPSLWKNKIEIIPKASHCPQLDQFKQFNSLLLDFYNSINL
jgi:pimeloyl-ACP methyl ester carboxylesterase